MEILPEIITKNMVDDLRRQGLEDEANELYNIYRKDVVRLKHEIKLEFKRKSNKIYKYKHPDMYKLSKKKWVENNKEKIKEYKLKYKEKLSLNFKKHRLEKKYKGFGSIEEIFLFNELTRLLRYRKFLVHENKVKLLRKEKILKKKLYFRRMYFKRKYFASLKK